MSANLFGGPDPTYLPDRSDLQAALDGGKPAVEVVAGAPDFSEAWAVLAEAALAEGQTVAAYAYARTGYHRGLDQLRRAGWKGHGPIPWSHRPNQGFLRALAVLAKAAREIGETEEWDRCSSFLADSDPAAPAALGL
ncbi:DUF3151 domain-containing protein [Actinokineospora sp. G85]|uniref:DUF3151 domain-containing protein n=1 Tax=Actinokineospora sp. G85 TaxID=3406626 RepID=UPI003C76539B